MCFLFSMLFCDNVNTGFPVANYAFDQYATLLKIQNSTLSTIRYTYI